VEATLEVGPRNDGRHPFGVVILIPALGRWQLDRN
jgi:hypothetical protein